VQCAANAASGGDAPQRGSEAARSRGHISEQVVRRGYGFGWADTPYKDEAGVVQVRPSWVTKLGIERRRRFHDFRGTAASHLLSGWGGARWTLADVSDFEKRQPKGGLSAKAAQGLAERRERSD